MHAIFKQDPTHFSIIPIKWFSSTFIASNKVLNLCKTILMSFKKPFHAAAYHVMRDIFRGTAYSCMHAAVHPSEIDARRYRDSNC